MLNPTPWGSVFIVIGVALMVTGWGIIEGILWLISNINVSFGG